MSAPRQPQDRQPKKATSFPFTGADGKEYKLPLVEAAKSKLSGRDLRDAAVGGEAGQLSYLFKALEAAEPGEKALNALYSMPQEDTLDVLKAWGEFGDGDGASLGK